MKSYTYRIIIEPDGKEYHGYVPALPGCHTHGATLEETKANLRDAIKVCVEYLNESKGSVPEEVGLESFETVTL